MAETIKRCKQCGQPKPLSDFGRERRCKDGHRNVCKVCVAERMRKYRRENQAAIAEYQRKYQQENQAAIAERKRKYSRKNCEDLADCYVLALLTQRSILGREDIPETMLEAKRALIQIRRTEREHKKGSTELG